MTCKVLHDGMNLIFLQLCMTSQNCSGFNYNQDNDTCEMISDLKAPETQETAACWSTWENGETYASIFSRMANNTQKKQFNFKGQATYPTQRLAALHFTYLCHLYWVMIWNCQTISHCWHSLTIEPRGWLQSIMRPIIHWLAASLLNNIPSLNMATLVQFSTMPFLWVNENFQS